MPEKNQSCSTCYFFLQTDTRSAATGSKVIGYCRANPPIPYYETDFESGQRTPKIARFPVVLGDLWCGMWDSRD